MKMINITVGKFNGNLGEFSRINVYARGRLNISNIDSDKQIEMNELVSEMIDGSFDIDTIYVDMMPREDVHITSKGIISKDEVIASSEYDHDLMIILK